jgi:hypothetical protein
MGFAADVGEWEKLVLQRVTDVVTECAIESKRSLVEGSEITGAPGQPVDTGFLKSSFVEERTDSLHWKLSTNAKYAAYIESGVGNGPMTLRSKVGGFHSLAMTKNAWAERIVPVCVERVVPK